MDARDLTRLRRSASAWGWLHAVQRLRAHDQQALSQLGGSPRPGASIARHGAWRQVVRAARRGVARMSCWIIAPTDAADLCVLHGVVQIRLPACTLAAKAGPATCIRLHEKSEMLSNARQTRECE